MKTKLGREVGRAEIRELVMASNVFSRLRKPIEYATETIQCREAKLGKKTVLGRTSCSRLITYAGGTVRRAATRPIKAAAVPAAARGLVASAAVIPVEVWVPEPIQAQVFREAPILVAEIKIDALTEARALTATAARHSRIL